MKDVTDIFVIDEETKLLVLNKKEIRSVKQFKDILERDKGGHIPGDSDGRKKLMATKEFMYIYLYANPFSIYRDLSDDSRAERCKNHAELPDIWKVDPLVQAGIDEFTNLLSMSALLHSYVNANRAVYAFGEDLKFFNSLRDKMREAIKDKTLQLEVSTNLTEDMRQTLEAEIDHTTGRLMDLGIKINNISNNLPNGFDTIETLKTKLLKESQGEGNIYGGGKVNNREK